MNQAGSTPSKPRALLWVLAGYGGIFGLGALLATYLDKRPELPFPQDPWPGLVVLALLISRQLFHWMKVRSGSLRCAMLSASPFLLLACSGALDLMYSRRGCMQRERSTGLRVV